MTQEKEYIGTYKVVRIYKNSKKREVLRTGLTFEEAKEITSHYENNITTMVLLYKQ